MSEIASDTPIKDASAVDFQPNLVGDAHLEAADLPRSAAPPQPLIGASLTVEKWLTDALSDIPETASDRPINDTVVMIQSIELAVDSQPDIVGDEHVETPDQGGTAHTTAASLEPPVEVNREQTVELAKVASKAEKPDNWREKWERAKSMLDPAQKQ